MTAPVRWSSPGSEVDPVLRSVLRYARDITPSNAETQELLARLETAQGITSTAKQKLPSLRPRRPLSWLRVAAIVFGVGGAAFAAVIGVRALRSRSTVSVQAGVNPNPVPKGAEHASFAAMPPDASTSAVLPASSLVTVDALPHSDPSVSHAAVPRRAPTPSEHGSQLAPLATEEDDDGDATLLHRARAAMSSSPYRALTFAQQHAKRFPSSPLGEERSALQVEALFRLGRTDEAKRARDAFESRFPNSLYRHRLRGLVSQ